MSEAHRLEWKARAIATLTNTLRDDADKETILVQLMAWLGTARLEGLEDAAGLLRRIDECTNAPARAGMWAFQIEQLRNLDAKGICTSLPQEPQS